jgi:hypothetical protein
MAAKAVALVQTVVPIQGRARPLTEEEIAVLRRVYQNALTLFNVRVVEGRGAAGVFGVNSAPFVLGNVIYMKDDIADHVFLHESVHVWQYQHGGSGYISRALRNQSFDEATNEDFGWELEVGRGRAWRRFGGEAQAWFIEDLWEGGQVTSGGAVDSNPGVFYDADGVAAVGSFEVGGTDYSDVARGAVAAIRAPMTVRFSALIR